MNQNFNQIFIFLIFLMGGNLSGQSLKNYSIQYEKKVNLAKLFPRWEINDKTEKFHTETFKLVTDGEKSYYQRQEKNVLEEQDYLSSFMTYSNTYIDIKSKRQISQKEVGERTFLLRDSLPKFQWHIHDETRSIAGYTCRKAMAKYADSVIIVAYFTEQLEASIGPESIGGLPGTILGLVIPKLHTTWLASSVESLELNPPKSIAAPTKGTLTNVNELVELVKKVYKDYPNFYSIIYRVVL